MSFIALIVNAPKTYAFCEYLLLIFDNFQKLQLHLDKRKLMCPIIFVDFINAPSQSFKLITIL